MQMLLDKLYKVLNEEKNIYENLLKISETKTDIVVEGKVKELENLVKIEQDLIVQVGKEEAKREEIINTVINVLQINEQEISLSKLYEYVDIENKEKLEKMQNEILKILDNLRDTNKLNSKLIQQSLDYVEFSMNVIQGSESLGNDYQSGGKVKEEKGRGKSFFDVKL